MRSSNWPSAKTSATAIHFALLHPRDGKGRMRLLCKQEGILAGIEIRNNWYFDAWTPRCNSRQILRDGDRVKPGDVAFYVSGRLQPCKRRTHPAEHHVRMSGVATDRAVYADKIKDLHSKSSRRAKPPRACAYWTRWPSRSAAVGNHRMGLFDMILLKDNHIDFAGGIRLAIEGAKSLSQGKGKNIPIECEVRSLEDIDEVFAAGGVDRIMFDNFTPELTRQAVAKVAGRCETESSGGITLDTLREYAETGVDFISVGALTHQDQIARHVVKSLLRWNAGYIVIRACSCGASSCSTSSCCSAESSLLLQLRPDRPLGWQEVLTLAGV